MNMTKLLLASAVAGGVLLVGCERHEATRPLHLPDEVVASVDNTVLTWAELEKRADALLSDEIKTRHFMFPSNKLDEVKAHYRRQAIDRFFFKTIMLDEARRENIRVDAQDIQSSLQSLEKSLAGRHWTTNDFFNNGPLPPEEMKKSFDDGVIIEKLLRVKTASKLGVPPEEIEKAAKELAATNAVIRGKLEELRAGIVGGKQSFEAAARSFARTSQAPAKGGDLGEVVRGSALIPKQIENAVFAVKEGEVSEVLAVPGRFVIYQMVSKSPAQAKTDSAPAVPETAHLREISFPMIRIDRKQIMDVIRRGKYSKAVDAYYKELRQKASLSCPIFPELGLTNSVPSAAK